MSVGHCEPGPGEWRWQNKPQEAGKEGMMDAWAAEVAINLQYGANIPAVFAQGRTLSAADFPGVRLPSAGRFWCAGLRKREQKGVLAKFEVRWLGIDPDAALTPVDENLIISGLPQGAFFSLLDATFDISTTSVELPQNGTRPPAAPGDPQPVYADASFLPPGTPIINPITGDYQRTRLFVNVFTRDYSGIAVGSGNPLPSSFRCNALALDPDGIVNLEGTGIGGALTGSKIIRVAQWWPERNVDVTDWRRASLTTSTIRRMGRVRVIHWRARFEFTPPFSY